MFMKCIRELGVVIVAHIAAVFRNKLADAITPPSFLL